MQLITIYVTYPDLKTAKKIAASLLKKRLIACANFFPIQSSYWWNGKIENSRETVSLLKTLPKNWEKVKTEVIRRHPYDIPCLIKFTAEANSEYENWLRRELN